MLLAPFAYGQKNNIVECLSTIDFEAYDYIEGDINLMKTDTLIDLPNGYFEIHLKEADGKKVLLQAAKFNNHDGSITLSISGTTADGICQFFPFKFFRINENASHFSELKIEDIIPSISIQSLLSSTQVYQIIEQGLEEFRVAYENPNLTLDDLLEQVFSYHFILPRERTTLKVTLSICDYEIGLTDEEWDLVSRSILVKEFAYKKDEKLFSEVKY